MSTFESFVSTFDPSTKGFQFEYFVKWFLENDPEWVTQVDKVWLWDDYPDRWGPDCGVDLVFRHKNGEIWAVQAKCYDTKYSITKHDVDKFLSESNRKVIDKRLLIATTDNIGKNAKQVCAAQEKPVTLYLNSDFEQASINYPKSFLEINTATVKSKPLPRSHQLAAIKDVVSGFNNSNRGQLIMACGTGKTFTTLWIKEELRPKTTLVLLPSLSLLSQTLREWTSAANISFDALCVCSDESVGKKGLDETISNTQDVSFPTTSDPNEIKKFINGDMDKVIFSTYQSSPSIAEAQKNGGNDIDLVIADEAHRCTGESGSAFTTILDQTLIKANKRLFTTATPRTYSTNIKKKASERGIEISGMDNELVFGSVFHSLNFSDAIDKGLLTDYQVVIIGVDAPMINKWIANRELVKTKSGEVVDAKSLAAQIGLIKAIKDYNLKRMISFHSRVKRAEDFASSIQEASNIVDAGHKPDGCIWADVVSGQMSTHKRRLKLEQLKSLTQGDIGLLSNARCLSEGVDVPSLDGVAFIDPRASQVDIVQAVGRAIRLSKDKTVGTIILPVFIDNTADADDSIQSSDFNPIWGVINALKSHDERLSFELDQVRTNMGKKGGAPSSESLGKIVLDLPETIDTSFSKALTTHLVERTTSSWNFWYGLLEKYILENDNSRVDHDYVTSQGYKLGNFVGTQRYDYGRMMLSQQRISKLENLKGWAWSIGKWQWDDNIKNLIEFSKVNKHTNIPAKFTSKDGFKLGQWVSQQRIKKDDLDKDKLKQLESIRYWIWSPLDEQWKNGYQELLKFYQKYNHSNPHQHYKTSDGFNTGTWASSQRIKRNKLSSDRVKLLEKIPDWSWDYENSFWLNGVHELEKFYEEHNHSNILTSYKTKNSFRLGQWVTVTRRRAENDKLSDDNVAQLQKLNFDFNPGETLWNEGFKNLKLFFSENKSFNVPMRYVNKDGYKLGQWVGNQRTKHRINKISEERVSRLESIGFEWNVRKNPTG